MRANAMNEDAIRQCRATLEEHSKSFALAARLLPPSQRDAAAVVYAWCRRADDAVDEVSVEEQPASLAALEAELDQIEAGERTGVVELDAFAAVCAERSIPLLYPRELVRGMAMDVEGTHYATFDDLFRYCHRVAGVVGLMMCHVMGVRREWALVPATHMGWAMQLTNICRDVAEDHERSRVYLPDELLDAHGVQLRPDLPIDGDALKPVVQELLAIADLLYACGDRGLRDLSWRNALAVDAARRVYSAIGERIEAQRFDVTRGRAIVPRDDKLRLVAAAAQARAQEALERTISWDRYPAPAGTLTFEEALRAWRIEWQAEMGE